MNIKLAPAPQDAIRIADEQTAYLDGIHYLSDLMQAYRTESPMQGDTDLELLKFAWVAFTAGYVTGKRDERN